MASVKNPTTFSGRVIEDPKIAKFLFSDVRMSWVWLIIRIWLGYQWIDAALHKITNPACVGKTFPDFFERFSAATREQQI